MHKLDPDTHTGSRTQHKARAASPEPGWLLLPGTGLSRATVPAQGLATPIEAQSVQNPLNTSSFSPSPFFLPSLKLKLPLMFVSVSKSRC